MSFFFLSFFFLIDDYSCVVGGRRGGKGWRGELGGGSMRLEGRGFRWAILLTEGFYLCRKQEEKRVIDEKYADRRRDN